MRKPYVEFVRNFDEFRNGLHEDATCHHSAVIKVVEQNGLIYEIEFKIYGIKSNGYPLVFQNISRWYKMEALDNKKYPQSLNDYLTELIKKYADPIGSTEGKWEY